MKNPRVYKLQGFWWVYRAEDDESWFHTWGDAIRYAIYEGLR